MNNETIFSLSGTLAMAGWAILIAAPLAPRFAQSVSGLVIPLLLSIGYAVLILVGWSGADDGFGSLSSVQRLFDSPTILLAGWLHYLAFDLLTGAWQVRTANREEISHLIVIPCLALTFLFGPAGFLLFQFIRSARWGASARTKEA